MAEKSQTRNPEGTHHQQVGGAYTTGINPTPGGEEDVVDVTPLPDRSDGTSEHNRAQQESISRQVQ